MTERMTKIEDQRDGWCLYKALAYALKMSADDLNEEIMGFIENESDTIFHGTPISEWIRGESGLTPQEYARKHRDRTAWGGAIEMAVCAHIKIRNIRVSEWCEYPRGYIELIQFGQEDDSTTIELVYISNKWYECLKYNFFAIRTYIKGGTEEWRRTWEEIERLEEIEKRLENGESETEEEEDELYDRAHDQKRVESMREVLYNEELSDKVRIRQLKLLLPLMDD